MHFYLCLPNLPRGPVFRVYMYHSTSVAEIPVRRDSSAPRFQCEEIPSAEIPVIDRIGGGGGGAEIPGAEGRTHYLWTLF